MSIHDSAYKGNIEVVKQHIAAGADVNAKNDDWGTTPLYRAAIQGHKEIVELLITKGADVNAKISYGLNKGEAPLDYANTKIAELLRKHGGKTGEELKAEGQ
jgi:ankyrin repeat protein